MNFSSVIFLFFMLPASVAGYALCYLIFRHSITALNIFLCTASLGFYYMAGEPALFVVLGLVLGNYIIEYIARTTGRKAVLHAGIVLDVLVLVVFKYPQAIASALGSSTPLTALYPLGISFISFHCISYLADAIRGEWKPPIQNEAREFLTFSTYLLFFPKIAQGPIVRYRDMRPELAERSFTLEQVCAGGERFLVGLAKKVLLADQLGQLMSSMPEVGAMDAPTAWLGVAAYGFQLYFDFSGYSDMAIGLSRAFGFHLKENFRFPYLSRSVTEFWQRWHISLGAWFREYVYIPLGGSRRGSVYLNLFIIFLLTGMWHGNTAIYICWGLMYGILCVLERTPQYKRLKGKRGFSVVGWLYTTVVVFVGWLCFRLPNVSSFFLYLRNMLGMDIGELTFTWRYFLTAKTIALLCISVAGIFLCSREKVRAVYRGLMQYPGWVGVKYVIMLALFALSYTAILSNGYSPFLYFQY